MKARMHGLIVHFFAEDSASRAGEVLSVLTARTPLP
jgi:hypothetical protein